MIRPTGLLLLAASMVSSVVAPASGVAQAQGSPVPSAAVGLPQDACALVSTDELSAIDPAVTLTLAIATPGACNYAGSPPDRPYAGAYLTIGPKPPSLADVAIPGDVRDVPVGSFDGRVGTRDVIVSVGPWLLRINGVIATADPAAWLVAAAAIAAPRLAALAASDAQGPVCARLGGAAVQAILGAPIGKVMGTGDSCDWSTGDASADQPSYVNVEARVGTGDLEVAGLAFKEFEDVDVAGRKGAWVPEERRLFVETGAGGLVTVTFLAAPDEVATRDHAIALAAALLEAGAA